jgi:hypothetical protein
MSTVFYVYIHARPDFLGVNSIFYIGKGVDKRTRLFARRNSHHQNITKKYGKENIVVRKLACESERHALDLEVQMIAKLRTMGVNLCNATNGGDGTSGRIVSPETRAKISANKKNPSLETRKKISDARKNKSPEERAYMSKIQTGRKASKETREKISKALSGLKRQPMTVETKLRISASNMGKVISEHHRAAVSAAQKGRIHTKEHREKLLESSIGRKHSVETRERMSEVAKKREQKKREKKAATSN